MRRFFVGALLFMAVALVPFQASSAASKKALRAPMATIEGKVTALGTPLAGVLVSDGRDFATTDTKGRYSLVSDKAFRVVFVVTPNGYVPTSKDGLQPDFWQLLTQPADRVEQHDFTLLPEDQTTYGIMFITDEHLCNAMPQKPDLRLFDSLAVPALDKVRTLLAPKGPVYTFNLGDLSHDRYWYSQNFRIDAAYGHLLECGVKGPMYSINGNHDHDPAIYCADPSRTEFESQHLYRRTLGPAWYSMNIGGDHWIMMNNMQYINHPGTARRYKGVVGDRNYGGYYSPDQIEWLEKDLALVPEGTRIYMCSHAPMFDPRRYRHPKDQVALIDSLVASRGSVMEFFAGHVHRMENTFRPECPHIRMHALPATSGNMWECWPVGTIVGLDGTPGGVEWGLCSGGNVERHYMTYGGKEQRMRVYDMNSVRAWYASEPDVRKIFDIIPPEYDYASRLYENGILVNYWWLNPGDRVEIYENGRLLPSIRLEKDADPIALVNHMFFRLDEYAGQKKNPVNMELTMTKLFYARAAAADSGIKVVVRDIDGNIVCEEQLQRGKTFSPACTD